MTDYFPSEAEEQPPVADILKMRSCLRCSQPFESAGVGERICRRCKGKNSWRNGIAATHDSARRR